MAPWRILTTWRLEFSIRNRMTCFPWAAIRQPGRRSSRLSRQRLELLLGADPLNLPRLQLGETDGRLTLESFVLRLSFQRQPGASRMTSLALL